MMKRKFHFIIPLMIGILLIILPFSTQAQWAQSGNNIDGEQGGDTSGRSVALSSDGRILAIGAINNDGTGPGAGHVRVYTFNGTSWTQRGNDIDGEANSDQSGYSVALSSDGNTLAVGARLNDGTGNSAGHTRVYIWNGATWIQRGNDINGEAEEDQSGFSVALSADGSILAVGAPENDGTGANAGHTRVYTWDGNNWVQRGNDIDGEAEGDQSGWSVALSADGNILAIGANLNDGTSPDAGHVRIYTWNGATWTQRGSDIDGEAGDDRTGFSTALAADGNTVAIGARLNDDTDPSAGHVRVYTWNGAAWIQKGSDIDGEAENDNSGWSVALSADGNILAVGAPQNSGTNLNAGHTRVYTWQDDNWIQRGDDFDGEEQNDQLGISVALSADGNTLATGATGVGLNVGQVKVYTFTDPQGEDPITSLSDTENEAIVIYPNPTESKVAIERLPPGKTTFTLTDILGNEIRTGEVQGALEMDFSTLPKGVYILTFSTSKGTFSKKVVKG